MIRDKELTEELINYAKKIGVDIIGFADPKDFERFDKLNRPETYLPTSNSVVIIAIFLYDMILDAWSEDRVLNKSYHFLDSILENQLNLIKNFLQERKYKSVIISYTPGLFLKDTGVLAGLGPIGKNNLLITEKFGSQIRLRALTTEAPLINGNHVTDNKYCQNCSICIENCPANALSNGKYDKEACLTYNLSNLIKLSKNSSIWCNICIDVCPYGKKAVKIYFKK